MSYPSPMNMVYGPKTFLMIIQSSGSPLHDFCSGLIYPGVVFLAARDNGPRGSTYPNMMLLGAGIRSQCRLYMYFLLYIYTYVYIHICVCIYMCIYIYIHTYIGTAFGA